MKLPGGRHLNDLALFAATLAVAAWQDWSATDLVWSLWISSLVVGYAFVVTALLVGDGAGGERSEPAGGAPGDGGGRGAGDVDATAAEAGGRLQGLVGPARTVAALFLLVFFTVHFGFFHYGHSVFLNEFFPLVGPPGGDASAFRGPVWWADVVGTAVARYWPFLLATAASRRADFRRSVETVPDTREAIFRPYWNVLRMHVLIFVFAGLEAVGLTGWAVYPVLFFYFFPLGALKALVRGEAAART